MKASPTLAGGLRIDAENPADWLLLQEITQDATACDRKLTECLSEHITDEEVAEDWREFVLPDLEQAFQSDLALVSNAITTAYRECNGQAGPMWITRDEAEKWYSALNQARLSLEQIHQFGPAENLNPAKLPPVRRKAFMRSHFYCTIQSLLLEHVLS